MDNESFMVFNLVDQKYYDILIIVLIFFHMDKDEYRFLQNLPERKPYPHIHSILLSRILAHLLEVYIGLDRESKFLMN